MAERKRVGQRRTRQIKIRKQSQLDVAERLQGADQQRMSHCIVEHAAMRIPACPIGIPCGHCGSKRGKFMRSGKLGNQSVTGRTA